MGLKEITAFELWGLCMYHEATWSLGGQAKGVVPDTVTNKNIAVASADGKRAESVVDGVLARHGDGTATLAVRILTGRYHQAGTVGASKIANIVILHVLM